MVLSPILKSFSTENVIFDVNIFYYLNIQRKQNYYTKVLLSIFYLYYTVSVIYFL